MRTFIKADFCHFGLEHSGLHKNNTTVLPGEGVSGKNGQTSLNKIQELLSLKLMTVQLEKGWISVAYLEFLPEEHQIGSCDRTMLPNAAANQLQIGWKRQESRCCSSLVEVQTSTWLKLWWGLKRERCMEKCSLTSKTWCESGTKCLNA